MSRKPLSNVDTAWLRMEDPTNLMMITGVMIFDAPMDFEHLKATVESYLLRFDRFRQRVIPPRLPMGPSYWEDDPNFDLDHHLQRVTLSPPGDQAVLQDLVSELMSKQLDFFKPLWQLHLVENYGDGCALIGRLHHCIADGIALIHVLLSMTDTDPDAPWPVARPRETRQRGWRPLATLLRPAQSVVKTTLRVTETLWHESLETLVNPSHALDLARLGTSSTAAFGRLVLRSPDPKTLYKGELGVAKRAAWSAPIPLKDVKTIGRRMEGTVNDVLLTAMTGALRRYMQGRGEPVDGVNFRAVVPVNLRPPDAEPTLGNKFGLVFLSLPIGIADPIDRLRELKQRMDGLKGTPEAVVAFGILNTMGMAISEIQDVMVDLFQAKATAVMTNVPGPREKLYMAGAPLDTLMAWVPQSGRLGLGVSIISYVGQVLLGIATDEGLVPDPETIVDAFRAEFDEMLDQAQKMEATPRETVQAMATILDDAIASLDAMLEDTPKAQAVASPQPEPATSSDLGEPDQAGEAANNDTPARCQALTKSGRQCKNHPLPGSNFCRVHQGMN
jgi:WS/DGAT/MGAT family acyltransferase